MLTAPTPASDPSSPGTGRPGHPVPDQLDALVDELAGHPVYQNRYFQLLDRARWTERTYALHRANFFYRTELTVKAIAQVCARSAGEDDQPTLILFSYILNEECGNGDPECCHAVLMERAHNVFGAVAFGLEPLRVTESKHSPLITRGTERYRRRMQELCSASYQRMLGVAMALESHAEKMLTHCRTAFRAYAGCFAPATFVDQIEIYFNSHLNEGVELRHADDARACVRRNCRSAADLAEVAYGAREALEVQLHMWQDLHDRTLEIGARDDA
jgi:Iron-containing redox enzyme